MNDPKQLSGFTHQRLIADFLHGEFLHTLGAYKLAGDKASKVVEALEQFGDAQQNSVSACEYLNRAASSSFDLNTAFMRELDMPAKYKAPNVRRFPFPFGDDESKMFDEALLEQCLSTYKCIVGALNEHLAARGNGAVDEESLGARLALIHDPVRCGPVGASREKDKGWINELIRARKGRQERRLKAASECLPKGGVGSSTIDPADAERLITSFISCDAASPTPIHVLAVEALTCAHMLMHHAEHIRSAPLGENIKYHVANSQKIEKAMNWSIALNTFAYVVGRSFPWAFAQDENERAYVYKNYKECHSTLSPTYCMWIGQQISLLALHRRAYSHWIGGARDEAYRDFYKLNRLLRELRQRVDDKALRAPNSRTTIEGLSGISEHHIGRIYRGQHAHRAALRYFDRASRRMRGCNDHPDVGPVLHNSRWRVNLLVSQGKANYELGKMKKALFHYVQAWRAFLQLVESETETHANLETVDELLAWLRTVMDDPALNKYGLESRFEPLVRQFESWHSPNSLALAAADIMMRLGHLLFVLGVPNNRWHPLDEEACFPADVNHDLAYRCLTRAAMLDPNSTLTAADLNRIKLYDKRTQCDERPRPGSAGIAEQWPQGGSSFEEAARAIEYALQAWLVEGGDIDELNKRERIARGLLESYLTHTDSSNVKLAQVYKYLMQKRTVRKVDRGRGMDFVCLRRYSSFFPFLPRPMAFRSLGGGYFVHIEREPRKPTEGRNTEASEYPRDNYFGLVVDPGPDFIDNLYRCGYCLADVDAIVLTHDHADHSASLDALLTLLGIRMELGEHKFLRREDRALLIVGNKSIVNRYQFYNERCPVETDPNSQSGDPKQASRRDAVRVVSFDDFKDGVLDPAISAPVSKSRNGNDNTDKPVPDPVAPLDLPEGLRIRPVRTRKHRDANGYVAQGFMLEYDGPLGDDGTLITRSIFFSGDTGRFIDHGDELDDRGNLKIDIANGDYSMKEAVCKADVVVAHLSSIPLPELRRMAKLDDPQSAPQVVRDVNEIWRSLSDQAKSSGQLDPDDSPASRLINNLQFGFRSRPEMSVDETERLSVTPLDKREKIRGAPARHLFLEGLIEIAESMRDEHDGDNKPLLVIGELREELGTFRTKVAWHINKYVFDHEYSRPMDRVPSALTGDIGLKVRLTFDDTKQVGECEKDVTTVLCSECDLDYDLAAAERYHRPETIREVCVKGENEGVFYNCRLHDPGKHPDQPWLEAVERFDVFGD